MSASRHHVPSGSGAWRAGLALLLGWCMAAGVWAETAPTREYQVKAAFLLRFLQFVEWPEQAFGQPDSPLRIGILGEDPFGVALDHIAANERVRNRPLLITRSAMVADLRTCHMIFVANSERDRLDEVAKELPAEAVLTISDIEGFAERGGTIRFYLADKKVRFEINPTVAQRQHLKVSAQLLSLGKIVGAHEPVRGP